MVSGEATAAVGAGERILEVTGLRAGYDGRPVVYDVDLAVFAGRITCLFGSNGAGKTTCLRAISGLLRPFAATMRYRGQRRSLGRAARSAGEGIVYIPSERFTFADLSVEDNLALGGYSERSAAAREEQREEVLEMFPVLGERLTQQAGTMSGGQQRMLSIAMALMSGPRVLLLDEPSLGLAPAIVEQLMESLRRLASERGVSVLMVEQNVGQALRVADYVYVIRSGRIILEGEASRMRERDDWWDLF
jgi:branched-chain amino acid transport system ATP-binding protein